MLGLNKAMTDLLLSQAKKQIQAKGIRYIAIIPDPETSELNVRAFKNKGFVITENILYELETIAPEIYSRIIDLNNTENKE